MRSPPDGAGFRFREAEVLAGGVHGPVAPHVGAGQPGVLVDVELFDVADRRFHALIHRWVVDHFAGFFAFDWC